MYVWCAVIKNYFSTVSVSARPCWDSTYSTDQGHWIQPISGKVHMKVCRHRLGCGKGINISLRAVSGVLSDLLVSKQIW